MPDTLDVAAEIVGGRVESVTSSDAESEQGARGLIDGNRLTVWESEPGSPLPQGIVLSFHERQPVLVSAVVVQPPPASPDQWPKDVEVWASMDSSSASFTRVAAATLLNEAVEHAIRFDPVEARFLELRILTNHGNESRVRMGDVRVLEGARPGYVPLADRRPDLARIAAVPAPGSIVAAVWRPGTVGPAGEVREDDERIYVEVRSNLPERRRVTARWTAVDAELLPPDTELQDWGRASREVDLEPGPQRGTFWIDRRALPEVLETRPPSFLVGTYRVELSLDQTPWTTIEFEVAPALPAATRLPPGETVPGFNVALAALGGRIESVTGESDTTRWDADHLIDGVYFDLGDKSFCDICGWTSPETPEAPPPVHEIVFSFNGGRETLVESVVVDASTYENLGGEPLGVVTIPRHVEVWVSTTSPTDGFSRVAAARLHPVFAAEQVVRFPPARARFVKLRLLNNFGGRRVTLSEVEIHESPEARPSIVADHPRNVAARSLGGAVARYTSAGEGRRLVELIDGRTAGRGWASSDSTLPQEIVFAFRGDQVAAIDRLVLTAPDAMEDAPSATWPKTFRIAVSQTSPLDGYEDLGTFTFAPEAREQTFPIGRRARFVRLRILENHGGDRTSLGEVQLIESAAPGDGSVLLGSKEAAVASRVLAEGASIEDAGAALERESNDTPADANPLGLGTRADGQVDPLGEEDHFSVAVPAPPDVSSLRVLTLELAGRPHLRTSLAVVDSAATATPLFEPGTEGVRETTFSWAVAPGDRVLRLTAPPVSLVLVWDTSRSMSDRNIQDLETAVRSYLEDVQPSERLNLIRFSGSTREANAVEVLLPEFTSDRARLLAAVEGKFARTGGTPLYDAIGEAITLLSGVEGPRAILLMTDGADTTSELRLPELWSALEQERIQLYAVGLGEEMIMDNFEIGSSGERLLGHLALAHGGRFFLARSSDELGGIYDRIAAELRKPPAYSLRVTASDGAGRLAVTAEGERIASVAAPGKIELILDASGSMKRRMGARTMMDVAKEATAQIIQELPDDVEVALRFYGHRIREGRRGDCQDSELVFPFGRIDKPRLLALVEGVRALGTTPIAYSLQQVAGDVGGAEGAKMVVLVTDGKEECRGDPGAAVDALRAAGIDVRVNIVGFALADTTDKRQMRQVAERTGGSYFDATDAGTLSQAIRQALALPYDVQDVSGTTVATGVTGPSGVDVPAGVYTVVVPTPGEPLRIAGVRVSHGGSTEIRLRKEGGAIGVEVAGP
ncbi:MAG TPA: VWA domain-containing protein [Gemmatimonadota bacterium]